MVTETSALLGVTCRPGAVALRSVIWRWTLRSSISPLTALIEAGISLRFCSRLVAVTMTSSTLSARVAPPGTVWAWAPAARATAIAVEDRAAIVVFA